MCTPDFCRQRAADVRRKAESMIDPKLREQLQMVARGYDYLAKTTEGHGRQGEFPMRILIIIILLRAFCLTRSPMQTAWASIGPPVRG